MPLPPLPSLPFPTKPTAPYIESGIVTAPGKGWHRVYFKAPFVDKPAVVAFMESEEGWFKPPEFNIPNARVSHVYVFSEAIDKIPYVAEILGIPHISDIPRIYMSKDSIEDTAGKALQNAFKDKMGDWGILNWLRDKFSEIFYYIGKAVGYIIYMVWKNSVQPQVDKVRDSINDAMDNVTDSINNELLNNVKSAIDQAIDNTQKTLNDTIQSLINRVNNALSGIVSSTNASLIKTREALSEAVEDAILKWYEAMGLEKGQLPMPALVRNIDKTGFDVFVPKANIEVHYIAVGLPSQ